MNVLLLISKEFLSILFFPLSIVFKEFSSCQISSFAEFKKKRNKIVFINVVVIVTVFKKSL